MGSFGACNKEQPRATTTRGSLYAERETQQTEKLKTILKDKKKRLEKKISSQNNCHTEQKKLLVYKAKQNKCTQKQP